MPKESLRISITLALFVGSLLVVGSIVGLTAADGFTPEQQKFLLLVIPPLMVPSLMSALRYHLKAKSARPVAVVRYAKPGETVFGLGPVILFPVVLVALLVAKAFNIVIREFDGLVIIVAIVEGIFGGIMVLITQRFFAKED